MKRLLLYPLIMTLPWGLQAQKLHLTIFGGASNYQGDLQGKRFTFQQANAAVGLGVLYELSAKLFVRANITFGKIKGDDKISRTDPLRNLSFSSPLNDLHLGLEYDILNLDERLLSPYLFAGVSAFRFDPSALDSNGTKTLLQPLGTEGQGFYLGREKYKRAGLAIPLGGGLKLALSPNTRVRFEIGLRKTFTDYLDDVSTTYAPQEALLLNNGPASAALAFRGDENNIGLNYPAAANTIRGNPKSKDWYYFTGIGISFRLSHGNDVGRSGRRSSTGCPVNVY